MYSLMNFYKATTLVHNIHLKQSLVSIPEAFLMFLPIKNHSLLRVTTILTLMVSFNLQFYHKMISYP